LRRHEEREREWVKQGWRAIPDERRSRIVDKIETVALMAATIYSAGTAGPTTTTAEAIYGRIAAQAWALYDAVEIEATRRHSK
jgi:hypothetical protein